MFEWLSAQDPILVYTFLFFNAFFESLFPPYPSDIFVLVFAFVAGKGYFNPYVVYTCTVLGSISGIMVLYSIGRSIGDRVIQFLSRSFLGRFIPVQLIEKAKHKLVSRGDVVLLLNRFLPGMRAPICFAAGTVHIISKKVFFYSFVSVLIWNFFLVMIGFYVGATWQEASKFLRNYNIVVTLILIVVLIIFVIVYFRKKARC